MPRGRTSEIGTVTVNANGYSQTKVAHGKWVGTHVLILEKKLGRQLKLGERAIFKDGDKGNLDPENIELVEVTNARTIKAKIAKLQAEIEDRQGMINDLELELTRLESEG
jgi:hypothetical protein